MRMRKKKHTEERIAACSYLLATPEGEKGAFRKRFPGEGNDKKELRLEIGCGKGAFILETAKREPEVLFLAVEICREALLMAMEKVRDANLSNVLFLSLDAAKLTEVLAPGEVDSIYLNFSDPWPKSRHAKRRLTSPAFLALYRTLLREGGCIRQKTDNLPLFEYSLAQYDAASFRCENVCRDLHASPAAKDNVLTEYEKNFAGKGMKILSVVAYKE